MLFRSWFVHGVNWVIKSRPSIYTNHRLDGPPGPMIGKIVFHPGTPAPEADGSYIIGEFRPETGVPLPIAVRLIKDEPPQTNTSGTVSGVPAANETQANVAQTLSNSAPAAAQNLTFGPVVERVVDEMIDFDTGRTVAELPESVTKSNDIAKKVLDAIAWMEREGMDAICEPSRSLKAAGMKAVSLPSDAWEQATPDKIEAALAAISHANPWLDLMPDEQRPKTWAFQTREGGKGLLQIIAVTADGVKVRYKLVQSGWAASGPNIEPLAPAAPKADAGAAK